MDAFIYIVRWNGGGQPKLCEPEPLTSKVTVAALWKKEQIDLAERLRWVEKWRYERLAEHFGVSRSMVRDAIGGIKANPAIGGLSAPPPAIRGR